MDQSDNPKTVTLGDEEFAHASGNVALHGRYSAIRKFSEQISDPLSAEDCCIQSMDDASPTRWHLAHTTWFFETFLLKEFPHYRTFDESFEFLFNSYYNTVGKQFPRSKRGLISRPGLEQTLQYREHVDNEMDHLLSKGAFSPQQRAVLEIGLNHEQQHQELMLTDIKHALSVNPLDPVYSGRFDTTVGERAPMHWISVDPGIAWIGNDGREFAFDNERPRHRVFLEAFEIADRCVTNREYLQFIDDGGYERPEFWLSAGWDAVLENGWAAPLYWDRNGDDWTQFTLAGRKSIEPNEPVCHVSYFEADAYARWAGCRLATEAEWESVASDSQTVSEGDSWSDRLIESGLCIHPRSDQVRQTEDRSTQLAMRNAMGNLWEWTSSHYSAYPGYQAPPGALGEYNGKFMCNVFVLKGGSCATPSTHARSSYRNFFSPATRWQFSGIRLARS